MIEEGKKATINGAVFIPFFDNTENEDIIHYIVVVDDGGDKKRANDDLKVAKLAYVGGAYGDWPAFINRGGGLLYFTPFVDGKPCKEKKRFLGPAHPDMGIRGEIEK